MTRIKTKKGFKLMMGYSDTLLMAIVEWNLYEDYINVRNDADKPATSLIPIRANENVI